jgi:dTMP kinase
VERGRADDDWEPEADETTPRELADDQPTAPLLNPTQLATGIPEIDGDRPGLHVRMFGSRQFFRLWLAQLLASMADWLALLAITVLASRISSNPEAAIGLVLSARIIPGFFLAPLAGVVIDRLDRKKVMVICLLVRAGVLALLPFVNSIGGLVAASLVLEVLQLLWAPAKEASVPNLVPADRLTTANSLSLVAAYGTMPFASAIFALLSWVGTRLATIHEVDFLQFGTEGTFGFYTASLLTLCAGLLITTIHLPAPPSRAVIDEQEDFARRVDFAQTWHELKEGWHFIFITHKVRAVNLGMAVALIGAGMLVPLGPVFVQDVIGAGEAGFGLLLTSLGIGMAIGVSGVSALQKRLPKERLFVAGVFGAGLSLLAAASMPTLGLAATFVLAMGVCGGTVYVLGFTLLHESVGDELRGRVFAALYTLVRLCVLISFALGPFLAAFLEKLSQSLVGGEIDIAGVEITVTGVRLTLWLAGFIIIVAGAIASHAMRAGERVEGASVEPSGE